MGVITKLNCKEINNLIKDTNISFNELKETKNGITDSTYIGIDINLEQYIFKVFEASCLTDVKNEIFILNSLQHLKVPRVISLNITCYKNKPTVLFSFIKGKIPKNINIKQIEEITSFMSSLHKIKNINTSNRNIYTKTSLKNMLNTILLDNKFSDTIKEDFSQRFEKIKNIYLQNNALIHGDLFPDNSKFIDNKLNGVYDFGQSCFGNSYFDLSVLVISWCFKEYIFNYEFFNKILEVYSQKTSTQITKEFLKQYLLYASLFYAIQRITRSNNLKDYNEYLKKFDIIKNEF